MCVVKIDAEAMKVVLDEEFEDITFEDLVAELPDSFPRYVLLTTPHDHGDGRVSYPMLFIYLSPAGCKVRWETSEATPETC